MLNHSYRQCVGAGRATEGLRADWQRQLKYIKEECGFEYIRFHGLLGDDMGVYTEDKQGSAIYNWQYIDELFDYLLSIRMKPFVELGFMPAGLASGKQTVFWWKGNITPPKDYYKWDGLIKKLIEHWTERYGHTEVASWYFEVWNEPNLKNLFFSGDQPDYFKLYQRTATAIKAISNDYRVGGPATAGNAWIIEMINFCADSKTPIDFISTHDYGVKQGFLDQSGDIGVIVSQNKAAVYGSMINTKKLIQASVMPNLELHYTEWSSSYTPTDPIHDTYYQAAYILDKIKHASKYVNSMSYWTFTDIFEELGPRSTPFHGGFGLLNYQNIKKPAFYAYQFLNKLGNIELKSKDTSAIACKSANGDVQILMWDFTITHPGDSVNDQIYYKRDNPSKGIEPVKINVSHLARGQYQLDVYKVGYRINDAYSTYFDMQLPSQLSKGQVAAINQKNSGAPIITSKINVAITGSFKAELPMRENDVYLVTLQRLKN
ncbi:xylan 1,4-beta-xylosidase [Mucilaginibacter gracilis]|uniref:Glycoside hydrolase family 39 n=2 Tax=Mucilaginibacter TaxID=423349 RepID=H1YHR9_9SPHI|nr:glycoside hydrolase family 39 [Mucilaginibacter paludis DSM 18603]RKR81035.1 xylan 1,4-beta-xylosidase [Mucilaginibacter gracilis]